MAEARVLLEDRVLLIQPEPGASKKWICMSCGWASAASGLARPLEHILHQAPPTQEGVRGWLASKGLDFSPARHTVLN